MALAGAVVLFVGWRQLSGAPAIGGGDEMASYAVAGSLFRHALWWGGAGLLLLLCGLGLAVYGALT